MINEEIGTYPICESILINPKLKVQKSGKQLIAKINGVAHIGNLDIIRKCVDAKNLVYTKRLTDNVVVQAKTAVEIYSDIFGIVTNSDKANVYNPDEIWEMSKKLATAKAVVKSESKFKLEVYDDTRSI